jgi:hypothetical protein
MLEANATCGGAECETEPVITYDLDAAGGYVSGGNYTVTCNPEGDICPTTTETGEVHVIPCPGCCDAVAPRMCTCVGQPLSESDFTAKGAGCTGNNCPSPAIDTSGVNYDAAGEYDYTVTCGSGCEPAEGTVCVENLKCAVHTGTYGTADLINDDGDVMGTVTVSIGGFNYLNVNLAPATGWTIAGSKMYAGVTAMDKCDPELFGYESSSGSYQVLLSDIPDWNCGDILHVNLYAEMQKGVETIEKCTGDITVDGYYSDVCYLDPCWNCGTCGPF